MVFVSLSGCFFVKALFSSSPWLGSNASCSSSEILTFGGFPRTHDGAQAVASFEFAAFWLAAHESIVAVQINSTSKPSHEFRLRD
jgi:hypothetical protein